MSEKPTVLLLCGGPDPEHDVSLESARCIRDALEIGDRYTVDMVSFESIKASDLAEMPGDVVWPALHGKFGEGGEMQRLLEADGRPFVGTGSEAASIANDKLRSKEVAAHVRESAGLDCVGVSETVEFDGDLTAQPMPFPFIVKSRFEGSSIGLRRCENEAQWGSTHEWTVSMGRGAIIEPFVNGREITVGMIDRGSGLETLPFVEIRPWQGLYDYQAKYERTDTNYLLDPDVDQTVAADVRAFCVELARRMGLRGLCRADFMLDEDHTAWFLEVNTMPGFTEHSLVPMACPELGMSGLCELLVSGALTRSKTTGSAKAV